MPLFDEGLPVPKGTFRGQTVLMTAIGDPVSDAIAQGFSLAGAKVAALGSPEAGTDASIDLLVAPPGKGDYAAIFDQIENALGAVSILVHSTPRKRCEAAENVDAAGWRQTFGDVMETTFLITKAFAERHIGGRGDGGNVLFVTGTNTSGGGAGNAITAAAEASMQNLAQSLSVEWASDNIRLNVLETGLIKEMDDPAFELAKRRGVQPELSVPLARLGTAEEVAFSALFLCSPYASYVSGAALRVDGGEWLRAGLGGGQFTPPRTWTFA